MDRPCCQPNFPGAALYHRLDPVLIHSAPPKDSRTSNTPSAAESGSREDAASFATASLLKPPRPGRNPAEAIGSAFHYLALIDADRPSVDLRDICRSVVDLRDLCCSVPGGCAARLLAGTELAGVSTSCAGRG